MRNRNALLSFESRAKKSVQVARLAHGRFHRPVRQLDQLVEATQIELNADDIEYMEALYQPVQNLLSIGTS